MNAPLTVDQILSAAEAKGFKVNTRTGYMQCPAHRGNDLNCHVFTGTDGVAMAHCHSNGCPFPEIKKALGFDTQKKATQARQNRAGATNAPKPAIVATYDYEDVTGELVYQTVRLEPGKDGKAKSFYQRRPGGKGGWINDLKGVEPLPYRLRELLESTGIVLVVEGEKDVDNLRALGFVATCNHGGAGKWTAAHAAYLAGRDVAVTPDNEDAERKHAAQVVESLEPFANSIRVVTLPDLPEKGDASDWLANGGTADQLRDMIETTMPWERPKPEDGAGILSDVSAFLRRFVAYPSDAARDAHTLWIAHTHLMGAWDSTPRIAFLSPEPGSGKTRALEVSELLVPRPVEAVNMSAAALFRKVVDGAGLPTILYDECDTVFGTSRKDERSEDVRGLINAGHRRGAKTYRCVARGREIAVEEYEAFSAVALAGLGDLPDTIFTRSVVIRMRRRGPRERIEPFRRRLEVAAGHALRDRLAAWARVVEPTIGNPWPQIPAGIEDRDADVWEPLLAVADAAAGDWPKWARAAAVALVTSAKDETPSLGIRLLEDLRTVFRDLDHIASETLVYKLNALEEAPWAEISYGKPLNTRGLSQRLRPFGVKPCTIRLGDKTPKGYRRVDLADAWSRYLSPCSEKSATSATNATPTENPSNHAGNPVADTMPESATHPQQSATEPQHRHTSATENPSNGADVADVADVGDFPQRGECTPEPTISERVQRMPVGELTDEERAALNGSKPTDSDAHRCVDCGEPVTMRGLDRCDACVEANYQRKYGAVAATQRAPMFAAGEPGLDRYSR